MPGLADARHARQPLAGSAPGLSADRGSLRVEPGCEAVTFWGFTDRHSWINHDGEPDDALLYDGDPVAKPAYDGALDGLRGLLPGAGEDFRGHPGRRARRCPPPGRGPQRQLRVSEHIPVGDQEARKRRSGPTFQAAVCGISTSPQRRRPATPRQAMPCGSRHPPPRTPEDGVSDFTRFVTSLDKPAFSWYSSVASARTLLAASAAGEFLPRGATDAQGSHPVHESLTPTVRHHALKYHVAASIPPP